MPIRRSAGALPKEEPASAPEAEPKTNSSESTSAAEEQEAPAKEANEASEGQESEGGEKSADGATNGEKEEEGEKAVDGEKGGAEEQGKKKKKKNVKKEEKEVTDDKNKKVKRKIPAWATMSASKLASASKTVSQFQPKLEEILLDAIENCKDRNGASIFTIMKYVTKKYSPMELDKRTKSLYKRALKRLVEKGAVKQLKGKGFSGSFTTGKVPTNTSSKKKPSASSGMKGTLSESLPLIMTRLCEPKEASYILIKKYLEQHFPQLNVENRPDVLKNCLQKSVEKGYLEQITGKGASGTFQLKKSGNKVLLGGGLLEDAIVAAITAMNEPKSCSITILRKYLVENYKDQNVYLLLGNLKRTLQKCKMMGWMEQITGHGLSGSYQLSYPYYPSPAVLFPEMMEKLKQKEEKKLQNKRRSQNSEDSDEDDDDEDEDEEEDDSEDEEPPSRSRGQKRPAPRGRQPPSNKRAKTSSRKPAPAKRPAATKKVTAAAKVAAKAAASKKPSTPSKATPVKKAAPAHKPKTPIAKKMTSRVTKRPAPKKSPAKKQAPSTQSKTASRKSLRARK